MSRIQNKFFPHRQLRRGLFEQIKSGAESKGRYLLSSSKSGWDWRNWISFPNDLIQKLQIVSLFISIAGREIENWKERIFLEVLDISNFAPRLGESELLLAKCQNLNCFQKTFGRSVSPLQPGCSSSYLGHLLDDGCIVITPKFCIHPQTQIEGRPAWSQQELDQYIPLISGLKLTSQRFPGFPIDWLQ